MTGRELTEKNRHIVASVPSYQYFAHCSQPVVLESEVIESLVTPVPWHGGTVSDFGGSQPGNLHCHR